MSNDIKIPEIELLPVDDLKVDGKNPNKMTEEQEQALDENIRKFGFIVPIITNKDLVIADGEHRWQRAKALGMQKVPVLRIPLDEVDRRILRQVMNKLRGTHLPALDADEYLFIQENDAFEYFAKLLGQDEEELHKLIEEAPEIQKQLEEETKEVAFEAKKKKCPKCGFEF